jgi:hypothetical protein
VAVDDRRLAHHRPDPAVVALPIFRPPRLLRLILMLRIRSLRGAIAGGTA